MYAADVDTRDLGRISLPKIDHPGLWCWCGLGYRCGCRSVTKFVHLIPHPWLWVLHFLVRCCTRQQNQVSYLSMLYT